MHTEHLSYLIEVINSQSINKASKKLHLNHQYLSQIINALEDELGTKLLVRSRTGVALTADGKKALDPIIQINDLTQSLTAMFATRPDLEAIEIPTTFQICVPMDVNPYKIHQTIAQLGERFPTMNVTVREYCTKDAVKMIQAEPNTLAHAVVFTQLDDMLLAFPPDIQVIPLKKMPIIALVATGSPLLRKYKTISLKTMIKYNLVLYAPSAIEDSPAYHALRHICQKEPTFKYVTSNLSTFYKLLEQENCISLGIQRPPQETSSNIAYLPIRDQVKLTSFLLINKQSLQSPFIQNFIELYKSIYLMEP